MTKILLVRHGQSKANLEEIFVGHTDATLSDKGKIQAEKTAEFVVSNYNVEKIYSSDLSRAYETAKPIAEKLGKEIIADKNLREIYGGEWEGIPFADMPKKHPEECKIWLFDIGNATCPGGESVKELQKRAGEAIEKIAKENEGKTVVVATHATVVRVLYCLYSGISADEMKNVPWVSNASVTELSYENGKITVLKSGIDEHLKELKTELPTNV